MANTTETQATTETREHRPLGGSVLRVKGRPGIYGQLRIGKKRLQKQLLDTRAIAAAVKDGKDPEKLAEKALAAWSLAVSAENPDGPTGLRKVPFAKFVAEYVELLETKTSPRHAAIVASQLKRAAIFFGETPVARIGRAEVEAYFAALSGERGRLEVVPVLERDGTPKLDAEKKPVTKTIEHEMSVSTKKHHAAALSGLWRVAISRRAASENPVHGLTLGRNKGQPDRFLTADEVAAIVQRVPAQFRPLIGFLAETGMRYGEAMKLQWTAVDRPGLAHLDVTAEMTKSVHGVRRVHLTAAARSILKERLEARVAPHGGPDYVFARFSHVYTFKGFKKAVEGAGLPKTVRIHDLRHSLASRMVMAGQPISVVAQAIGDSLPVAMRYAKHTPKSAVEMAFRSIERSASPAAAQAS